VILHLLMNYYQNLKLFLLLLHLYLLETMVDLLLHLLLLLLDNLSLHKLIYMINLIFHFHLHLHLLQKNNQLHHLHHQI
jgi:hypothetical protein